MTSATSTVEGELQLLSAYPRDPDAGGRHIKEGRIGANRLPGLLVVNHGFYHAPNPVILWRNEGRQHGRASAVGGVMTAIRSRLTAGL